MQAKLIQKKYKAYFFPIGIMPVYQQRARCYIRGATPSKSIKS